MDDVDVVQLTIKYRYYFFSIIYNHYCYHYRMGRETILPQLSLLFLLLSLGNHQKY